MTRAYLAGPDVFLPDAVAHARAKEAICARFGIEGCSPVDEPAGALPAPGEAWLTIYRNNIAMMQGCDIIIANLTPFRGASADAGTLVEVGWFLGQGRPVFGYTNSAQPFADRSRAHLHASPDPMPGLAVEGFGLLDNLMIAGAVLGSGVPMLLPEDGEDQPFDSLVVFERCVAAAAGAMRLLLTST